MPLKNANKSAASTEAFKTKLAAQTSATAVGKRLRQAREELHMSQTEFAVQVGITRDQLANYERGRTPLPTATALKICRHFVIGEHWLAEGESWPWEVVDLMSEPEYSECNPNEPFAPNFLDRFFPKYFMLNRAQETRLTFRESYERLLRTAKGDKHRLWFILIRLLRKPAPISKDEFPPDEDPDDLADFYSKLIRICLEYEIKCSGGINREKKTIQDRAAVKSILDKQMRKALEWMEKNPAEIHSANYLLKISEFFSAPKVDPDKDNSVDNK